MEEKDSVLKHWLKEAIDEKLPSADFTDQVMNLISETPALEIKPIINRRVWSALLVSTAGLFSLIILASIDLDSTFQLPFNFPDISGFFLSNWLAFSGLFMSLLLMIVDEIWRRNRKQKRGNCVI